MRDNALETPIKALNSPFKALNSPYKPRLCISGGYIPIRKFNPSYL